MLNPQESRLGANIISSRWYFYLEPDKKKQFRKELMMCTHTIIPVLEKWGIKNNNSFYGTD